MYINNPIEKKSFKNYIVYNLLGSEINNISILRRYSDFFLLREKLKENWPGIYIPNIPPKKIIRTTNEKLIINRMRLLNSFCFKLSKIPYLFKSTEVKIFKTCQSDISKEFEKMNKISKREIYLRYRLIFKDYYESYDYIIGKGKISEFKIIFQNILINLRVIILN